LQNGSLIDDLWTVEGAGNTIVFDAWTDADGNDLSYKWRRVFRSNFEQWIARR
jgi:hypothetical protein